jgi:[ribosomal protein S18]-alanine N-acetyltransferase
MTEGDLEQVVAIEEKSFSRPWTPEQFRDELRSPYAFPRVAVTPSGGVAGYLCPSLLLDEGEILDVAVSGEFRGKGIGRLLVLDALEFFRERGALRVYLEVRVSNQAAISLYRSLGFRDAGCRKRYYENGEDALLMDIILNGVSHAV